MIHYTCDLCKRELDPDELRYVVKLEIGAAMDPLAADELDDDRDQLLEVQEILERLDDAEDEHVGDEVYQQMRFDLCPKCCRQFRKSPLGRDVSKQFDFSKN
jgi:hypothetical protein